MQVRNVSAFRFRLPLRRAVVLRKGLSISERTGVVLRVETDLGNVGWGEASPLPGFSRETVDDVEDGARDLVRRVEQSLAVDLTVENLSTVMDEADLFPSLEFAIGTAARMVEEKARISAQRRAARGKPEFVVPVARLLQGSSSEMIASAEAAVDGGFRCLKLKVGRAALREEIETVMAVRRVASGDVSIRLDANRSWSMTDAREFCQSLSDVRIEFLEEPLADPSEIPTLIHETTMPIALDESLATHADLIRSGGVAAAVVKPTVVGMRRAVQIRKWCSAQGVTFVPSCSYESCIGTSMVVLLALNDLQDQPPAAVGVGTHTYLAEDLCKDRLNFEGPTLRVGEMLERIGNIDMTRLSPII
ncbi:MAG: o-succinylbenzoate synthase [Rhodothermia bacterium]|nr:o-succinylbenzoate synthase [Rhodothermia bacterium]